MKGELGKGRRGDKNLSLPLGETSGKSIRKHVEMWKCMEEEVSTQEGKRGLR